MATVSELGMLLSEQEDRLHHLLELLRLELETLEQRNAPALDELLERKIAVLTDLERADKALSAHPLVEQLKQAELQPRYEQIQQLLQQVQQQNDVNGQVVRLTLGRIQTLKQNLQSLHGEHGLTYNEKGRTHGGLSGRGIKA